MVAVIVKIWYKLCKIFIHQEGVFMRSLYVSIIILLSSVVVVARDIPEQDPFSEANKRYDESDWSGANAQYKRVHEELRKKNNNDECDKLASVRGHVNYADVLYSRAVGKLAKQQYEKAGRLMLLACDHWAHRLEGGQFGRKPLNNEWDGTDLTGKRILVYSERDGGAFGDTFYMTPMLRFLKEKGAHVILVPQKPLQKFYQMKNTEHALYVDEVALRGDTLPQHDAAIYLWSILKYYLKDVPAKDLFPMAPWMSGDGDQKFTGQLEQRFQELKKDNGGKDVAVVGMWWRSSGSASLAADWRSLSRDPGANRMTSIVQGMPVLVVNLEGLGRRPLTESEYNTLKEENKLGNSDPIDITSHDTSNVFNFTPDFDKEVPFGDTVTVMEWIKNKGGILMGCDTGLANMAAGVKKNDAQKGHKSVYVILNKKADHRWGDDATSPRDWHHSEDVQVFQAQEQDKWEQPINQAREAFMDYIDHVLNKK